MGVTAQRDNGLSASALGVGGQDVHGSKSMVR